MSLNERIAPIVSEYVPISRWLRTYESANLRPDLISAVTSWGVMIPVALAYAGLAGVPPEFGLVTAFAALGAYAIFGTSRQVKVTTSSTIAIMSASIVAPLALGDPTRYLALTAALALTVGVLLVAAGLLRLGFVSEFLAKPVVTGFVIGVALTIMVGQLPKLLGVPSTSGTIFDQLGQLLTSLPLTNPWSLAVGLGSLAVILIAREINKRIPGPLIALVLAIGISTAMDLAARGVATVGVVATGLPGLGLPGIGLGDLGYLAAGAAGVFFLAMGESIGVARSVAMRHHYELDPDQELVALGAANLATGVVGGFAVDASFSQTATAEASDARTQLSSIVTAILVLATALWLAPLFANLPQAVLAAIIIASALSLLDVVEMRRYWQLRRSDALLALIALVGVLTTTVLSGLVIAVLLSLMLLLYRASRPYVATLGRLASEPPVYSDRNRHPDSADTPGMLLVRIDAPLYFFNVSVARAQILQLLDAEQPRPRLVIVDMGATGDLDVTSADMLDQLLTDLGDRSVELALVQMKGAVRDRLRRTGFLDRLGEQHTYRSMADAVTAERAHVDQFSSDPPATD